MANFRAIANIEKAFVSGVGNAKQLSRLGRTARRVARQLPASDPSRGDLKRMAGKFSERAKAARAGGATKKNVPLRYKSADMTGTTTSGGAPIRRLAGRIVTVTRDVPGRRGSASTAVGGSGGGS